MIEFTSHLGMDIRVLQTRRILAFTTLVWVFAVSPTRSDSDLSLVEMGRSLSGTVLTAWLSVPGGSKPAPAVIFLHGCSGLGLFDGVFDTYRSWAKILDAAGYAILMVDSAGPRGFGRTCSASRERAVMYRERPSDAYSALEYLQARQDVDAERIFLIGWSQGGGIVLLTMNTESIGRPNPKPKHDFRAAIALYPAKCVGHLQTRRYTTVAPGTWRTVAPILILQGAEDNWTPAEPCAAFIAELQSRNEPVHIFVYPDAHHSFDAPNMPVHERSGEKAPGGGVPVVGTNEAARTSAIEAALQFLAENQ